MIDIKPFKAAYIPDAAQIFANAFAEARKTLPLIPEVPNLVPLVTGKLEHAAKHPGYAAFTGKNLVGYMIELFCVDDFMGQPTGFCIELYPCASLREDRQRIYQTLYKEMSRSWIERGYHAHQFSMLATDAALAHTFYRLTFGMTHFQQFRGLDPPAGEIPEVDIRYLENEDLIREIDREHHAYYPNSPLYWIAHDSFHEPNKDRVLSGEADIIAAFVKDRAAAYFVLTKGTAETELFMDLGNGQIHAAYARPEYRGLGIGKALLAETVRWAKNNHLRRLYVEGESANIYGGNFWCRHFAPAEYSVRRCVDSRIRTTMFSNT